MPAISGKTDISPANNNRLIYTVPAGKCATVTVSLCNRAEETRTVGILIVKGPHTPADFIEDHSPIPPKGVLERTGVVMTAGENLYVVANNGTGVSARYHGFEEDA